jgi:mannitol/fructose-specific phosphotransferase system IIA component (Ntr-type)
MNQSLIDACTLIPALDATAKKDALAEILDAMTAAGAVTGKDRAVVLRQLHEREAQGSTGLGNGVAVPHVKQTKVPEIRMAVAISRAGIPFDAIDGRPVHIMFLVLGASGAAPEEHLKVLRWVSGLARNADFRRFAQSAESSEALRDLLTEMSGS